MSAVCNAQPVDEGDESGTYSRSGARRAACAVGAVGSRDGSLADYGEW